MIEKSDTSVSDVISIFTNYKIAAAFLVPTPTGMEKSIMDATAPIRNLLREENIHSYDLQSKGTSSKKIIEAFFIKEKEIITVKVSFYRPETKSGDPRIWIYGLNNFAKAYNLLALFVVNEKLYILNASNLGILATLANKNLPLETPATPKDVISRTIEPKGVPIATKFNANDPLVLASSANKLSPIERLALETSGVISNTAIELLSLLRDRAGGDFIPSVRSGATGIGATLEDLLGIKSNSRKTPDYKGIEIKASRQDPQKTASSSRVNLFSQVPDWESSPFDKAIKVLKKYGYIKDGRLQLYCTLDARKANSQNLMLSVDENTQLLKSIEKNDLIESPVMLWALSKLKERLAEKHPESFWIKAETKIISGKEYFRYYKVVHTTKPILSNLDYLLADGTVTLDLTLSQKTDNAVRDHGYLFKIWPEDLNSLFPPPLIHEISSGNSLS